MRTKGKKETRGDVAAAVVGILGAERAGIFIDRLVGIFENDPFTFRRFSKYVENMAKESRHKRFGIPLSKEQFPGPGKILNLPDLQK